MNKEKKFGFGIILKNYSPKLFFKGAIYPFLISFSILIIFIFNRKIDYDIIKTIVDVILNIVPSLLGFVLSGYAILIGFGNIEKIAIQKNAKDTTLYQKISSVFAIGLIAQVFLLVLIFVIKVVLEAKIECIFENPLICEIFNSTIFFIIIFCLLYITVMIKDLVINIFNFSQVQHLLINTIAKTDKEKSNEADNKSDKEVLVKSENTLRRKRTNNEKKDNRSN